jgi:hypothetical protein
MIKRASLDCTVTIQFNAAHRIRIVMRARPHGSSIFTKLNCCNSVTSALVSLIASAAR